MPSLIVEAKYFLLDTTNIPGRWRSQEELQGILKVFNL
jgi:hypothetical protein